MYRTRTESLARELASRDGLLYGWSVFPPGGYYVGTADQLTGVGVSTAHDPNADDWVCCARPVRKGGEPCGHRNAQRLSFKGLVCCEACGCTKHASDARRAAAEAR